jgi:glycosyltransferase involved in cell wall biosynthesis
MKELANESDKTMSTLSLTIFVPCFNEAKRSGIKEYLSALAASNVFNLVLVNDGSKDDTQLILEEIANNKHILISYAENMGKGEALRKSIYDYIHTYDVDFVGFLDCDGAFPIPTVNQFITKSVAKMQSEKFQLCIASRVLLSGRNVNRRPARHFISRIIITLLGFKFKFMPYDSQSGLKLFMVSQTFKESLHLPFQNRWLFDIELIDRMHSKNPVKLIWEEPVDSWSEKSGSHLGLKNIPGIIREIMNLIIF